jgi:FAD/FMN-containing dehydrogenase
MNFSLLGMRQSINLNNKSKVYKKCRVISWILEQAATGIASEICLIPFNWLLDKGIQSSIPCLLNFAYRSHVFWGRTIKSGKKREGVHMIEKKLLTAIVGAGNVTCEQATLDEYSSDISFVNAVRPACVVKPKNATDIQKLVKLANETLTPLVPVSSGPPHFRGDTVPGIGGAIIVDLSGMKKIINVDRARRVAMVEPGVTFGELIPAAASEGIRLNMPLLPRKSKTVVGSLLEREPVIMPKYQWDISDPLACAGVIFGTGDEFMTGQAAGPGTVREQWKVGGVQKAPYGPGIASWHRLIQGAQGTIGIVTWASMRCEILPGLEEPFIVGSSSLDILLEMASWLIRLRMVNECFILNNTNLAAIFTQQWPGDFQNIKDALPEWILFYAVAGYEFFPEERVGTYIKDISKITQRLGVEALKAAGGISANEILKAVQQPSAEPYWKLRSKGACEDIFFLTINDKLHGQIEVMNDAARKAGYPCSDMGIYIQPIVQGTGCHCEINLFYNRENAIELNRVRELSGLAVKNLMAKGAFFSRPYGENAGMIINKDAATVAVLAKLKKMFDPNHVMNPGKVCF